MKNSKRFMKFGTQYITIDSRDRLGKNNGFPTPYPWSVWASGFNRRVDTLVVIYRLSGKFWRFCGVFVVHSVRISRPPLPPWALSALHYIRGSSKGLNYVCRGSWRSTEVHGGPWGSVEISGSRWRSVEFRVGPRGPRRSLELQKRFEFFF